MLTIVDCISGMLCINAYMIKLHLHLSPRVLLHLAACNLGHSFPIIIITIIICVSIIIIVYCQLLSLFPPLIELHFSVDSCFFKILLGRYTLTAE